MVDKQELETREKAFAASIVSVVYAFVIQLTQNLALVPNHPEIHVDASIFVPAIASILFGKLIGAAGAAGGQFVNSAGSSLLTRGSTSTVALSGLSFASLIKMASDFISAWVVGSLTEKPNVQWDSFSERFGSLKTWSRLFQNTLGSVIGFGMVGSLLSAYSLSLNSGGLNSSGLDAGTSVFVETFFLNSAILALFIPITLLLYELGDVFIQVRAHAKDKSMRKLAKTTEKEDAVTIISTRLTENAMTENSWTPVMVKFRANLQQESVYKIEAVSTANYYPAFDSTKPLKKGETWEQKFFIMPAKQKNVDFKVRITPAITNLTSTSQNDVKETVVSIKGKSYNPNSNSATLVLFSIINSIMVGASVVWNNLITFSQNINQALIHLQQSWYVVLSTTTLETIIFVPILMYLRRRWTKSDSEDLTVGFGTDLSERSQKIYQKFEGNFNQFLDYFGVKLQRSIRLFLVFVTTVSVLLLGIEGYNSIIDTKYTESLTGTISQQLLIIGVLAIVLWLGGYKGIDILKSTGIIGEEKYAIQEGTVVSKFKPASDFISNKPNEVTFTISNPTNQKGIRFRFLSQDTVSPPLVEMPVPPGGSAVFKTSITPIGTGSRNIMIVVYPLFDENGQYIDENTAEPYAHQSVNYLVQSETQIGISKDQQSTLKKLAAFAVAVGAIIFGSGAFVQHYLPAGTDFNTLITNTAPYLLIIQAPFVYAYFYLKNNAKLLKGEMESLVEQINAMDNIAKAMNSKLDKTILKSTAFTKNIKTALNTTMTAVTGLSALKEINGMISSKIKDSLGSNFTDEISKVVQSQDLTAFTNTATQVISNNFSSDIQKTITTDEANYIPQGTNQVPPEKRNDLKQSVKIKVKQDLGDKIKKQANKEITNELKNKSSDSIVNKYKATIMANLKKEIFKELKKEIKDGKLVNNIEDQVFQTIQPEIQTKILDQINNIVFNRDMLENFAEELDSKLGTNLMTDFEDAIGTSLETEMAEKLKKQLISKYENEIMQKLESRIKKQINSELNSRGDQLIDDILNSKMTDAIQDKLLTTLQETLANSLDKIVDQAIDTSIDSAVDTLIPF